MARSSMERRLEALEDAAGVRPVTVVLREVGWRRSEMSDADAAAWVEAHPPRMSGSVLVKYALDDAEEA